MWFKINPKTTFGDVQKMVDELIRLQKENAPTHSIFMEYLITYDEHKSCFILQLPEWDDGEEYCWMPCLAFWVKCGYLDLYYDQDKYWIFDGIDLT